MAKVKKKAINISFILILFIFGCGISKEKISCREDWNDNNCKKLFRTYPSFDYVKCENKYYECVPNTWYKDEEFNEDAKYIEGTKYVNCHEIEDIEKIMKLYKKRELPKSAYTTYIDTSLGHMQETVIYEVYD